MASNIDEIDPNGIGFSLDSNNYQKANLTASGIIEADHRILASYSVSGGDSGDVYLYATNALNRRGAKLSDIAGNYTGTHLSTGVEATIRLPKVMADFLSSHTYCACGTVYSRLCCHRRFKLGTEGGYTPQSRMIDLRQNFSETDGASKQSLKKSAYFRGIYQTSQTLIQNVSICCMEWFDSYPSLQFS